MRDKEYFRRLCAQAAVERDSEKLTELFTEIERFLQEQEARLKVDRVRNDVPGTDTNAA